MWRHLTTFYHLTSHTVTIPRTDRLNFFSTKDIIKRRKTETKAQHYWKRWLSDGKEFENVSSIGSLALLSGQRRSQGLFCTFSFEVIYQQRVRGFHQGFQTPGKRWKDVAVAKSPDRRLRRRPSVLLFQLPLHDTMKSCLSPHRDNITFYFAEVAINRFFFALAIFYTSADPHLTEHTLGGRDSREINKFKLSKSGAY